MEIATATALTSYNYYQSAIRNAGQTAAATSGTPSASTNEPQLSAVAQALASVFANTEARLNSSAPTPTDTLAVLAGAQDLAPALGELYSATKGTSLPLGTTSNAQNPTAGLNGYSAVLNLNSTLALTAYTTTQNAGTSTGPTPQATVQAAVQTAQASLLTNTLNLIG